MWTIRQQTPENIEVVLAMHNAQFSKQNVLCEMTANCVTAGMKDVPGANGSPNFIILQGQWESSIVRDESTWSLDDGKLVLDIRKRVEGEWKILIRSGINGDDAFIDPLSRVILGVAAEQIQNYALALQCYERSAQEGSWHAMRKLAALYSPNSDDAFPNIIKDTKKSISYVQMGAEQPWNSDAQFILAHAYSSGFGVDKDNNFYMIFLQKAASFGKHPYAMFELAENLLRGQLVTPDPTHAVKLLEQAAALGHVIATWTLGQLLIAGCDGVQRDPKRGIAYVSAALKEDPSLTKKTFSPFRNPELQADDSTASESVSIPASHSKAAGKAGNLPSSLLSRLPLYGVALFGAVLLATVLFPRMRRK